MVSGQVFFQWVVMYSTSWQDKFKYMFIVLNISMLGSMMLIPVIAVNYFSPVEPLIAVLYFFAVVSGMFLLHIYVLKRGELPWHLTYTWVLYRLLLLTYLISPQEVFV